MPSATRPSPTAYEWSNFTPSQSLEDALSDELADEQDKTLSDDADDNDDDDDLEDPLLTGDLCAPPAPPRGLREISSLASWTVSSSKPGCGVAALRAPNTNLYWQSDGPQPHHLNIHFFKMVAIVGMRIYLNYEDDESYTPTLIRFAAGTGYHDLQEFSVMRFEKPVGWLDVEWDGVGEDAMVEDDHDDEYDESSTLRCMLVQVRICENHQNGKDTHLRGLQIYARDKVIGRNITKDSIASTTKPIPNISNKQPLRKRELSRNFKEMIDIDGWMDTPVIR